MKKLLLLHGALGAKNQLEPIEKILSVHYSTNAINFSGHGGNPIPDEPFSIKLFAQDVLKWMEEKKLERINIFGYSMGGYVALYLAKHFPEKINKIVTLATKFNWTKESSEKEVKFLDPKVIEEKIPKYADALVNRHGIERWEEVLNKTAEMMLNLGRDPELSEADFNAIQHEVKITVGAKDEMVTVAESSHAQGLLQNGKLHVFPEFQHPIEKVDTARLCEELMYF